MNILAYSAHQEELHHLDSLIKELPVKINFVKSNDTNKAITLYKEHNYDNVIIHNKCDHADKLTNEIKLINPQEKIILINEHYSCHTNIDCNSCQEKNHIGVLIKPYTPSQLITALVKDFKCEQFKLTEESFLFEKVKKESLNEFPLVYYSEQETHFCLKSLSQSMQVSALVFITEKLKKSGIDYSICEDTKIIQIIK